MGFEQKQIVDALTYLKKQRDYSPVGELDRALDLLYREQGIMSSRSNRSGPVAAAGNNAAAPVLKL